MFSCHVGQSVVPNDRVRIGILERYQNHVKYHVPGNAMLTGLNSLRRRKLLAGAGSLTLLAAVPARARTGIAAVDTPSLAVKNPAGVLLIAITTTPAKRLVAVGVHGVVIYSDDAGVTWTQANVPVNVTLTCITFATDLIGWTAGHFGIVLNTQDGGKSWQMQLDGIQANQLTELAAQDPSVATDPSPGAPLATRRAQHFMADGPDNPFLCMLVFSPQKVIVFGAYRMAMLTHDGGKTWADWSLHVYDKFSHNIYAAANIGDICYLVMEEGLVFASTDGANIFKPLTSPGGTTIFGILGAKDGSIVVFGVAGFAARSTDHGQSWTTLGIASQQDLTAGSVLENGTLILVDEAGLAFGSTDNGASFTRVQGAPPVPFFGLQEAPNGNLIAVGATGVTQIAKSLLTS
jgi:photosystem II stability/assembly factor-like uncharacterized protein